MRKLIVLALVGTALAGAAATLAAFDSRPALAESGSCSSC